MKSLAKVNPPERTLGDLLEDVREGGFEKGEQDEKETLASKGKSAERKVERSYRSDLEEGAWWESMKTAIGKRAAPGTHGQSPTPTPELMAGQPQAPALKRAKTSN